MYLENPKRLFKDLYNLPTMYCYMVACAEDGEDENGYDEEEYSNHYSPWENS